MHSFVFLSFTLLWWNGLSNITWTMATESKHGKMRVYNNDGMHVMMNVVQCILAIVSNKARFQTNDEWQCYPTKKSLMLIFNPLTPRVYDWLIFRLKFSTFKYYTQDSATLVSIANLFIMFVEPEHTVPKIGSPGHLSLGGQWTTCIMEKFLFRAKDTSSKRISSSKIKTIGVNTWTEQIVNTITVPMK